MFLISISIVSISATISFCLSNGGLLRAAAEDAEHFKNDTDGLPLKRRGSVMKCAKPEKILKSEKIIKFSEVIQNSCLATRDAIFTRFFSTLPFSVFRRGYFFVSFEYSVKIVQIIKTDLCCDVRNTVAAVSQQCCRFVGSVSVYIFG